jgi:hypothetical protein
VYNNRSALAPHDPLRGFWFIYFVGTIIFMGILAPTDGENEGKVTKIQQVQIKF